MLLLYTVTFPHRCNFTHQPSTCLRRLFFARSAILWPVMCSLMVHHCFYCCVPSTSNGTLCVRKFTSQLCQIKSKPMTSHKGVNLFCTIEQKFIVLDRFPQGNSNRFSFPLPSLQRLEGAYIENMHTSKFSIGVTCVALQLLSSEPHALGCLCCEVLALFHHGPALCPH